jgi:hypothetical protein
MKRRPTTGEAATESLKEEADTVEGEARMVLPGIQALFGFQMIAIFNERFDRLGQLERNTHVGSLLLVTLAIALIMAPAAYRRLAGKGRVSRRLIRLASAFLCWAMVSLAAGIGSELWLVTWMATGDKWTSAAVGIGLCAIFTWLWFLFPLQNRDRAERT